MRPKGDRRIFIAVLVVLAALTAGTLFMINDLDEPFDGLNELEPTEMERISIGLEEDFATFAPDATLPCDEEGAAT
jgi:hypothetical protein